MLDDVAMWAQRASAPFEAISSRRVLALAFARR
jgi:hypothetical protein